MQCVRILAVTGASGVGKTTLVRDVESRGVPGVSFHYFDSIGVPPVSEMVEHHGSAAGWQDAMTDWWVERLASRENGLCVLDGQVRPTTLRNAFARYHVDGHILLIDCLASVRDARLRDSRQQPELATPEMAIWQGYLRGQADALRLPVLDTSDLTIEQAADALHGHISTLAAV